MNIFVIVFVMLALDAATCKESPEADSNIMRKCTEGWERFGSKCYKYVKEEKTWAEAEQYCLSLGGNLASVHSMQTHQFLKRLSKSSTGVYSRTWIGGYDAPQEFIWLWSDGSLFDFSAWHSGEPNNGNYFEGCVEMNYGAEVLWNDHRCNIKQYSVCQKAARINILPLNQE